MIMITGPVCEPSAQFGVLARGVVVHDKVNVQLFGSAGVQMSRRCKKERNSWCRWRGLHSVNTAPVAMSRAAERVVVS